MRAETLLRIIRGMDIDNLNRTQILLLTLLVSFVTSIATGIVTVSLLEQAPPGVTQTINRVVERTVEKVVPTQGAAVVTKETTVVVKEDDLVTKSIQKDAQSIVSIFQKQPTADGTIARVFAGWGIVLSGDGIISTDSGIISDTGDYSVKTPDGKYFDVKVLNQDEDLGIALLQAQVGDVKYTFTPATLGDASKLQLGQSVIIFGGKERQAVSLGNVSFISTIDRKVGDATTTESVLAAIEVNIPPAGDTRGGPLANIFGEIVGMSAGDRGTHFVSENLIEEKLNTFRKATSSKSQ